MTIIKEFTQDNVFETDRLWVRRLRDKDFPYFHEMQGDYEVMKFVAKKSNTEEEDRKDLQHLIKCYSKKDNDFWVWAMEDKDREVFVGTVAIVKDKEDNWEIGYRLIRKEWKKGYATEVVLGILALCHSINEIDNIMAYADLRNLSSQNVLVKTGFVNLGIKYNEEEDCEDYMYVARTTD